MSDFQKKIANVFEYVLFDTLHATHTYTTRSCILTKCVYTNLLFSYKVYLI